MTKQIVVDATAVAAAQALVRRNDRRGRQTDEATRRLANARRLEAERSEVVELENYSLAVAGFRSALASKVRGLFGELQPSEAVPPEGVLVFDADGVAVLPAGLAFHLVGWSQSEELPINRTTTENKEESRA